MGLGWGTAPSLVWNRSQARGRLELLAAALAVLDGEAERVSEVLVDPHLARSVTVHERESEIELRAAIGSGEVWSLVVGRPRD